MIFSTRRFLKMLPGWEILWQLTASPDAALFVQRLRDNQRGLGYSSQPSTCWTWFRKVSASILLSADSRFPNPEAPMTASLVDAFHPDVTKFQTKGFSLAEDLDWLDRLRGLGAPVGVILHCARILEVLVFDALAKVGLTSGHDGLKDAMGQLKENAHLSKSTYRLLDPLRGLGNTARHALKRVDVHHAEQGYAIALRGMHWYFCEFPSGPGLKSLSVHNHPLDTLLPSYLAALLTQLESADLDEQGFLDRLGLDQKQSPLFLAPLFPAILAERLLDSQRTDEAQRVLTAALDRFPDEVRLRQLQGLLWSRVGELDQACDLLEAIEATDSAADEETQGILAGAYKRRAEVEPRRRDEWRKASQERYVRGWQQSRETNTYLGINAAATALWLGQPGQAARIAESIRDLLEARRLSLARMGGGTGRFLNCWDQLTLAEAYLLLGDWDAARQHYGEARERFPKQTGALDVAREQAKKDLEALGRSDLLGRVFPAR
jgi:tetratricopeptide (TPR) repeat protein